MVDLDKANELAVIGRGIGADVVEGGLSYPSETGSWQLGDECPRCRRMAESWEADARAKRLPGTDVLDQVRDLPDGEDDQADETGSTVA
jgi:hypothetical protein